MKKTIEWEIILKDWITGNYKNLTELANKHNLNKQTLSNKAHKDKWIKQREEFSQKKLETTKKNILRGLKRSSLEVVTLIEECNEEAWRFLHECMFSDKLALKRVALPFIMASKTQTPLVEVNLNEKSEPALKTIEERVNKMLDVKIVETEIKEEE